MCAGRRLRFRVCVCVPRVVHVCVQMLGWYDMKVAMLLGTTAVLSVVQSVAKWIPQFINSFITQFSQSLLKSVIPQFSQYYSIQ